MRKDCTHPRARHVHGTRLAYQQDECRCFACRVAHSQAKLANRNGQRWAEEQWPSPVGIRRRLEALHAIGWTWLDMGRRLGITPQAVRAMTSAGRVRSYGHTLAKVSALYDELSMTCPVGPFADRARRSALRLGYKPPLAWDDDTIDDPTTEDYAHIPRSDYTNDLHTGISIPEQGNSPSTIDEIAVEQAMNGRRVPLNKAETSEAIARLTAMGESAEEIGQRLGISSRTVVRFRSHGESVAA